jgi:CRP-like cAMP-binding protein
VFTQGDESDVMYFVRSGEFECFKEDTAVATAARNSGVGELGVYFTLLGFLRPRKISIRRPRQRKQGCLKVEE